MRSFDIITFDCYGTLIDWEEGMRRAFCAAAARDGVSVDAEAMLRAYAGEEPLVEEEYRPYRQVLAEATARAAQTVGWALEPEQAAFLAESVPSWTPFPDTNAALERLHAAGHRLGILSNIDDDLLAATRAHFTVDFDLIITAQQLRSYKPAAPHFVVARERIGDDRWLHAAQSNFHDIVPTNARGIPNAWINRKHEQPLPGGIPGRELSDMQGLADWLA
jgi:2-haloalkanoic acid dehalogenase type II